MKTELITGFGKFDSDIKLDLPKMWQKTNRKTASFGWDCLRFANQREEDFVRAALVAMKFTPEFPFGFKKDAWSYRTCFLMGSMTGSLRFAPKNEVVHIYPVVKSFLEDAVDWLFECQEGLRKSPSGLSWKKFCEP